MTGRQDASGQAPLARKKAPREVERFIRERDAFRLEWSFGEGTSTFRRSIFGAMLTRADLYRHGTYPCFRCAGSPGVDAQTGDWCRRCKGTGFFSFENYATKAAVTAFPTLASQEGGGYDPSHVVLQLYAKIARRLDVVAARGAPHYPRVLERYHGDEGARWGRTPEGRIFAVVPETPAGHRLLMRVRQPNEMEMTNADRMDAQVKLDRRQPKKWRRELLRLARKQAEEMYGDAALAWNLSSFYLKASRTPNPPLTVNSAAPPRYATVREVIEAAANGKSLPVDVRNASNAVEYDSTQEPCRAPKCSKLSQFPFLYCPKHQQRQPRELAPELEVDTGE